MKVKTYILTVFLAIGALHVNASEPTLTLSDVNLLAKSDPVPDLNQTSLDYVTELNSTDISPSSNFREISRTLKFILGRMIYQLRTNNSLNTSPDADGVSLAVKTTLSKLDLLIDENYQWQPVYTDVAPPAEVPNATSGMDPNAISDVDLRQQYLASIEHENFKNLQNGQQQELSSARDFIVNYVLSLKDWAIANGLDEDGFIERFTNEGASRELLSDKINAFEEQ